MSYRSDIQGLRAIAVLLVMLFHFDPSWLPGGFVGVDVFFVISGYLIVNILLEKKSQPDYKLGNALLYFYVGRFKRIVPAYFFMLILVSLVMAVLLLPPDLEIYKASLKQAAIFNSNTYFSGFGDYFAPANHEQPLLHTWSLAVEIQFYLLAPLMVLLLPIKAIKWLFASLYIVLTLAAEYRLRYLGIQQETYYSLYARMPEFFAGGLVSLYLSGSIRSNAFLPGAGLLLILFSAAVQPMLGPFPGMAALLPVTGAVLVMSYPAKGFTERFLANKTMTWLGQLSFSLYLWHWPVLALLRYYSGSQELNISFGFIFITLTLLLSIASFYCVEMPLRVQGTRVKQRLGYALLAGSTLVVSPSMAKINETLSPPVPVEYQRYADPATICHGQIVGDCMQGDLTSNKEILVLGDSHAAMLNTFFDQLGKDLGFKARIITGSSCVTIPGFDYLRIPEWAQKPCAKQIEQAAKYLPKAKMVFIAASWNWQLGSENFKRVIADFFAVQSRAGVKVYILEQEPLLSKNPMRAIRFKALGLNPKIDIDPSYKQANTVLRQLVAKYPGVNSLNFESTGLFENAPFAGGIPIYMDEHHLNEQGAKRYAAVARSAFRTIME